MEIGKDCFIIAQVGIAGSTKVGNSCVIAGQSGVAGHLHITDHVTLGAKTGVIGNINTSGVYMGFPHKPHGDWGREQVMIKKLPDIAKRVKKIEKLVETIYKE